MCSTAVSNPRDHGTRSRPTEEAGSDVTHDKRPDADLLLLQRLHKRVLQPVGVLRLQSLLLIGGHALLTQDPPTLLPFPVGGEVSSALGAEKWLHAGQIPPEFTCRGESGDHGELTHGCRFNTPVTFLKRTHPGCPARSAPPPPDPPCR